MTEIYLGRPPAYIETWMKDHAAKSGFDMPFGISAPEGCKVDLTFSSSEHVISDKTPSLFYSYDGNTWSEWEKALTRTLELEPGKTVYLQAGPEDNAGFWFGDDYSYFGFEGKIVFSGNIMSLVTRNYGKDMSDFKMGDGTFTNALGYPTGGCTLSGDLYFPLLPEGKWRFTFGGIVTDIGNLFDGFIMHCAKGCPDEFDLSEIGVVAGGTRVVE